MAFNNIQLRQIHGSEIKKHVGSLCKCKQHIRFRKQNNARHQKHTYIDSSNQAEKSSKVPLSRIAGNRTGFLGSFELFDLFKDGIVIVRGGGAGGADKAEDPSLAFSSCLYDPAVSYF